MNDVIWHDIECGRYRADLPLWRELADTEQGPVLDVGAGTGRVTLDLARHGHHVVALDREPLFLATLRERAGTLPVETVAADAAGFVLPGRRFGLIIAPMQTVQLLGAAGRATFFAAARAHLTPHGLVACALADDIEVYDAKDVVLPLPDVGLGDGVSYYSQPMGLDDLGDRVAINRVRSVVTRAGERSESNDVIHLDKVTAAQIEAEGEAAGLWRRAARFIPETEEHVATTVVIFRG